VLAADRGSLAPSEINQVSEHGQVQQEAASRMRQAPAQMRGDVRLPIATIPKHLRHGGRRPLAHLYYCREREAGLVTRGLSYSKA
jgi:hypothetical protein